MSDFYTVENVPKGIPVQIASGLTLPRQDRRAKYGVVESVHTFPQERPDSIYRNTLNMTYLSGKRWKKIINYVSSNVTFVPLPETVSKKVQRIQERYHRTHLGEMITVGRPMLGMDPEIFVVDGKTNQVIPAFGFLPDKRAPLKGYHTGDEINAYWDGFQAEISTRGFGCMEVMCATVWNGLKTVLEAAKKSYPTAKLSADTVVTIDSKVLQSVSEKHVALGCSTSYNAYGTLPIHVDNPRELPFRFAGGHGHIGDSIQALSTEEIENIIKTMDAIVGVASVLWFQGLENPIRRQFYGRAGEYRRPKHGLEYRTLGNGWLLHPAIFHLVIGTMRRAYQFARSGFGKHLDVVPENVKEVIDNYDIPGAREIVRKNKMIFRSILDAEFSPEKETGNPGLKALASGIGEILHTPTNIEGNWKLQEMKWNGGAANHFWGSACYSLSNGQKI